jgi:hypothetical protein
VKEGEIVIFDKAYVDFDHLWDMEQREVIWVTRAKENLQFEVVGQMPVPAEGKVVADELVGLKNPGSQQKYPELMRRVTAWVEVDGKEQLIIMNLSLYRWSVPSRQNTHPRCCTAWASWASTFSSNRYRH